LRYTYTVIIKSYFQIVVKIIIAINFNIIIHLSMLGRRGWGEEEEGQGGGIWHSNNILYQISYPRDSSAGQIDRIQGQLKLFQRDFSNWIIHKGSILSLYLEIIGRLRPFFAKIYSRFSFEVWICLRRYIQQLQFSYDF
jgi:hypothetical protein